LVGHPGGACGSDRGAAARVGALVANVLPVARLIPDPDAHGRRPASVRLDLSNTLHSVDWDAARGRVWRKPPVNRRRRTCWHAVIRFVPRFLSCSVLGARQTADSICILAVIDRA
jgi:hypothetical protein